MQPQMIVALVIAIGVLLTAAYGIWRWGPGLRTHVVRCVQLDLDAEVLVEQREAEFGNLKFTDIKHCSLLKDRPVDCSKECLARL